MIKAGTYPKQDKDVPAIGYTTHIVAACDLPEDVVYKMTKAMATGVNDMAAVVKPIAGLTAKDMAVGHRCAVPQGRRQVLQGSGRDVAVGVRPMVIAGRREAAPFRVRQLRRAPAAGLPWRGPMT